MIAVRKRHEEIDQKTPLFVKREFKNNGRTHLENTSFQSDCSDFRLRSKLWRTGYLMTGQEMDNLGRDESDAAVVEPIVKAVPTPAVTEEDFMARMAVLEADDKVEETAVTEEPVEAEKPKPVKKVTKKKVSKKKKTTKQKVTE